MPSAQSVFCVSPQQTVDFCITQPVALLDELLTDQVVPMIVQVFGQMAERADHGVK